jgi:PAS domain S-box-containing protein
MGTAVVSPFWQGLLQDLAILAVFVPVWTHGLDWIDGRSRTYREGFGIALSGIGVILLMLFPFEVLPGIRIDLRCSLIIVAGFLGSPLIGVVTGGVAAVTRVYFGGAGEIAGLISIGLSTVLGIAGRSLLRGRPVAIGDVLTMAAASSLAAASGLIALPATLFAAGLPLAAMAFVATAFTGLAVLDADRRRDVARINQFYRSIIDALPEPLNAKDMQGRFVAANPATARQLGAPDVAAVIGKTDFDFHPLEAAREYRADEERVLAQGEPDTIEQVLIRDDGSRTWLSTLKSPLRDITGAITGVLTHNRDVTERKQLEDEVENGRQRLNDAMEHMADGLVMCQLRPARRDRHSPRRRPLAERAGPAHGRRRRADGDDRHHRHQACRGYPHRAQPEAGRSGTRGCPDRTDESSRL